MAFYVFGFRAHNCQRCIVHQCFDTSKDANYARDLMKLDLQPGEQLSPVFSGETKDLAIETVNHFLSDE